MEEVIVEWRHQGMEEGHWAQFMLQQELSMLPSGEGVNVASSYVNNTAYCSPTPTTKRSPLYCF